MEYIKLGGCCPRVVNNSIAYDIQADFNTLAENMPLFRSYAYCRNKKEFEEIQLNFQVKLWDIGEDFLYVFPAFNLNYKKYYFTFGKKLFDRADGSSVKIITVAGVFEHSAVSDCFFEFIS